MAFRFVVVAGLFACLCLHGMNKTTQVGASGNEWGAFVVFVKSESLLETLPHSKCLGMYKNPEAMKENVKGIEFMSGDMEKTGDTRPVDVLEKDYFAIDPITDNGAFLREFLAYSKKNEGDKSSGYALEILQRIAHDALITSQSAFVEYAGCENSVISRVESCYDEINKNVMNFIRTERERMLVEKRNGL